MADANNTIVVDLAFNVPKYLGEIQYVTISGLVGAVMAADVPMTSPLGPNAFCRNSSAGVVTRGLGSWDAATNRLTFEICADLEIETDRTLAALFHFRNPAV